MEQNMEQVLKAVINTLNGVTVSGRENMDRLLGSIVALERCVAQLGAQNAAAEAKPDKD